VESLFISFLEGRELLCQISHQIKLSKWCKTFYIGDFAIEYAISFFLCLILLTFLQKSYKRKNYNISLFLRFTFTYSHKIECNSHFSISINLWKLFFHSPFSRCSILESLLFDFSYCCDVCLILFERSVSVN
jgi:predicted membrane protein